MGSWKPLVWWHSTKVHCWRLLTGSTIVVWTELGAFCLDWHSLSKQFMDMHFLQQTQPIRFWNLICRCKVVPNLSVALTLETRKNSVFFVHLTQETPDDSLFMCKEQSNCCQWGQMMASLIWSLVHKVASPMWFLREHSFVPTCTLFVPQRDFEFSKTILYFFTLKRTKQKHHRP